MPQSKSSEAPAMPSLILLERDEAIDQTKTTVASLQ